MGPRYVELLKDLAEELDDFPYDPDADLDELLAEHMEGVWQHYAARKAARPDAEPVVSRSWRSLGCGAVFPGPIRRSRSP